MAINTAGYHVAGIARASRAAAGSGNPRVYWMGHENDERQIVIDAVLGKIVKRFRNTETAWSDAERWANDYAERVHRDLDAEEDADWDALVSSGYLTPITR